MNLPRISEIEIIPVRPQNGLLAFVNFLIDEWFAVGGIGIHSRPDGSGIRLLYPDKLVNGLKIPLFHPVNRSVGDFVTQKVWEKFTALQQKVAKTV